MKGAAEKEGAGLRRRGLLAVSEPVRMLNEGAARRKLAWTSGKNGAFFGGDEKSGYENKVCDFRK